VKAVSRELVIYWGEVNKFIKSVVVGTTLAGGVLTVVKLYL